MSHDNGDIVGLDPSGLRARYREIFGTPDVFVREVLQNAVQAMRLHGNLSKTIDVSIEGGVLEFRDHGVGMTYDQAQKALGRFFGSGWHAERPEAPRGRAGEFLEMLEAFLSDDQAEGMESIFNEMTNPDEVDRSDIGRFGMGLTTCLMVADRFDVATRPADAEQSSMHRVEVGLTAGRPTVLYRHRTTDELPFEGVGTMVRVHLGVKGWADGERVHVFHEYLDPSHVSELIRKYMAAIEIPIRVNGRLVVGGATEEVIPEVFFSDSVPGADADCTAFVEIAYETGNVYIRGRLGLTAPQGSEAQIRVFSRGVLVGDLPSTEILGENLDFVQGVLDTDMVDLQLDRNRLQTNAKLRKFQKRVGIWLCEALAKWCPQNWATWVKVVEANRSSLLRYLWSIGDATRALGGMIPFSDPNQPGLWLPLSRFVQRPFKTRDSSVLPFSSRFTDGHPAVDVFGRRGQAVFQADLYVPTEGGRANLDLAFVEDYLREAEHELRLMRADTVLPELALEDRIGMSSAVIEVTNALRTRLDVFCELHWTHLNTAEHAGLVATPFEQVRLEEAPKSSDGQQLEQFLERMLSLADNERLKREFQNKKRELARPTVLLNLDHPLAQELERTGATSHAIGLVGLLVSSLLLSSVQGPATELLQESQRLVAELWNDLPNRPQGEMS